MKSPQHGLRNHDGMYAILPSKESLNLMLKYPLRTGTETYGEVFNHLTSFSTYHSPMQERRK